jgi:hypothetical protein
LYNFSRCYSSIKWSTKYCVIFKITNTNCWSDWKSSRYSINFIIFWSIISYISFSMG